MLAHALSGDAARAEIDLRASENRRLPAYVSLRAMKAGEPTALCMVITDLSDRKQRDDLIAAGRLATSILESAAEAIAVCDENGKIFSANQALEDLCGFNPMFQHFDTALPLAINRGEPGTPMRQFSIATALAGTVDRAQEVSLLRRDGQTIPLLLSAGRIASPSGIAGCVITMTDMTEHERTEEEKNRLAAAIQQERDRLSALINSVNDEIWFADTQKRFTLANPAALHAFSYGSAAKIDVEKMAEAFEVYRSDGSPRPLEEAPPLRALRGEVVENQEEIVRTPATSELRHRQVSAAPVKDATGKIIGSVSVVRDITEFKQAAEALRKSEARYRNLFNTMDEGFCIVEMIFDAEGRPADYRFLEVNAAFERQTGLHKAEGKLMRELRPAHEAHWVEIYGRIALTGEPAKFVNEARDLNRWYDVYAYRVGEPAERQVAIVFNDITDIKLAEEVLRRQADLMKLSFDAIIVWRLDGGIESWNRGAEQLYGYSESEARGRVTHDLLRTDHPVPWPEIVARLHQFGQWEGELRHITKEGREVLVSARKQLIVGADGVERVLETNRDITERKRAQEALLRGEKLASVGRMASTIAHEINNPLETIGHAVYLALTDPGISGQAKSYLDLATQELERVTHITKQTLAFNREDKTPALIDLRASADSIVKLFAPRLKSRGITVEKRYAEVGCIRAGGGEIQQIISNLLSNSMDATPNHGKIVFRVSRSIGRNGFRLVRFTIADTGSGIPAERLKQIFEPFFTTKEMVGTGLGLWVTKQIVEKYGAAIRVRSKPGSGSVFSIAFPIAKEVARQAE
jgi:PAS domain S-box-containing protein